MSAHTERDLVTAPSLVAQVEKHLEEAHDANQNGKHETRGFEIQLAKVKVQLALVEQQRIANLIAMATWNDSILRAGSLQFTDIADEQTERIKIDRWFAEVRLGVNVK